MSGHFQLRVAGKREFESTLGPAGPAASYELRLGYFFGRVYRSSSISPVLSDCAMQRQERHARLRGAPRERGTSERVRGPSCGPPDHRRSACEEIVEWQVGGSYCDMRGRHMAPFTTEEIRPIRFNWFRR